MNKFRSWIPRRGVALMAAALLLGGCGLAGRGGSVERGAQYEAHGQYRAAYIEAKKVLQRNDRDGDAWLLLGRASLMLGDSADALQDLGKARTMGVAESRWAVPMAQALLVSNQPQKVLDTVSAERVSEPATKGGIDALRGDAQRALGQSDAARASYEAALKAVPAEPRALVGLSKLTMEKDPAAAARYVDEALKAAPGNPRVWVAKGDLAIRTGDFAGAESAYQKAIDMKPADWLPQESFFARGQLAESQLRLNQFDKALVNIKLLEKAAPAQPYPHYLHAAVLFQQGHLEDATTQLQQVLRTNPNNVPGQLLMGTINYAQGNYAQAEMYFSNVQGADPNNIAARRMMALAYFRQGRQDQALDLLRSTAPAGQNSDAQLLAALQQATKEGIGLPPPQQEAMAPAHAGAQPAPAGTAGGPVASAERALAAGNAAEAVRLLQSIRSGGSVPDAQRVPLLVMAQVRAGHPDDAVKTAGEYAQKNANSSAAHLVYGTALIAADKQKEARVQYDEALKLDPKNIGALQSLGTLDVVEKQFKQAEGRYETVLKIDPKRVTAMNALAKIAELQGDRAKAIQYYRQAIATDPKVPTAYLELTLLYSQAGQFDEAAAVAKQMAAALPDDPAALNAYGAAELNAGHAPEALAPLQQAVKLAPRMPLYLVNLARAEVLNKDLKSARAHLESAVQVDPAQVQAATLLAFMRMQDRDLPGALKLAAGLQKQPSPADAAGYALQGDLYMADKAYAKAADAYQAGLKLGENRVLVLKRFEALRMQGSADAAGVLQGWLAKHDDDVAARAMLAQFYQEHGQAARAVAEYERALKTQPDNVAMLNNLAWLYTEQKDPKALELAQRAHKLAPTATQVQDTYGWALLANNQAKAALAPLQAAAKAAPKSPTIQYHLAVAQARNGDKAAARATLAALQKLDADYPEKSAAAQLYQELSH